MLRSFRFLLLPFSFLYGLIIWMRNWMFDKNILKSASFNFPIICIGNIALGGTGKTPMTELVLELLEHKYETATLSRGYKRKTKGFAIANSQSTAIEIGDEPMLFHHKFPNSTVAVGEERIVAIPQLLHEKPTTEVIILDDAFQHRSVIAGLNIVLTEYNNLYTRDFMFPTGDLRDIKPSVRRADIIIVTKCDSELTVNEKNRVLKELKPLSHQKVFFTEIVYGTPYHLFDKTETTSIDSSSDILLICGIANPKPLKEHLNKNVKSYDMLGYRDHHIFSSVDLGDIKKHFEKLRSERKIIITTEKDAVRLEKFKSELFNYPIYALPIKTRFLFNDQNRFINCITLFIDSFEKIKSQ
jgi:tetraacyldisaccharide 4'-kinase